MTSDERRAARSEREAEERMRAERDSTHEGERRLAAVEAERRGYSNLFGPGH
jgi:hypothetical protein